MYDSAPTAHGTRAQTRDVATVCTAALGVARDVWSQALMDAQHAGHEGADAIATAYLSLADPKFGVRAPGGVAPDDTTLAAVFRGSPRRERDADGRRRSALARLGTDLAWQDQVVRDYQYRAPVLTDTAVRRLGERIGVTAVEALRRLTIAWCLRQQALEHWPANTRCGRKHRAKYVRARLGELGYWPDLRQQVYLPAPVRTGAAVQPRRARGNSRRHAATAAHRETRRSGFQEDGWEVAA